MIKERMLITMYVSCRYVKFEGIMTKWPVDRINKGTCCSAYFTYDSS